MFDEPTEPHEYLVNAIGYEGEAIRGVIVDVIVALMAAHIYATAKASTQTGDVGVEKAVSDARSIFQEVERRSNHE